jgi:hypothetical protein
MAITTIASAAFLAVAIQGINAVGVMLGAAIINIFVYYSLPDKFSKEFVKKYQHRLTSS